MSHLFIICVWCLAVSVSSSHGRTSFVFGGMESDYSRFDGNIDDNNRGVVPKEMGGGDGRLECKWFNHDCFDKTREDNECRINPKHHTCRCDDEKDYCETPEDGKRAHCYASWKNDTGTPKMVKAGCWLNDQACYDQNECVSTKRPSDQPVHFCCCEGNMCNGEYSLIFIAPTPAPVFVDATPLPTSPPHATIGYALIVPTVGLFFIAIAYAIYRRQKSLDSRHHAVPTAGDERDEEDRSPGGTPHLGRLRPIQLLEIKVRSWTRIP